MSHSLNEQSRITTVTPVDDDLSRGAQKWILDTLVEVLGFEKEDDKVYFDAAKTMGIRYEYRNDTYGYIHAFNSKNSSIVDAGGGISESTQLRIYWHKSTNEDVTYVEVGLGSYALCTIFANNTKGNTSIISFDKSATAVHVGNENFSTDVQIGQRNYFKYPNSFSIVRLPDPYFNDVFSELFLIISFPTYSIRNHLVNFNGQVYRLVYMQGNPDSYGGWAFPVSDSTTP